MATMKTVSLKIDEGIFMETEEVVSRLKKSRNRYINEAIDHFNQLHKRKLLGEKLKKESYAVRDDSMEILKDFEDIDYVD
jgi:hypothetical protein